MSTDESDSESFYTECFFIAPIGAADSPIRQRSDRVLKYIVSPAMNELGLRTRRADEFAEPGHITLQLLEHVVSARAAVADLTTRNANVYYELAVRHFARRPVVLIADVTEELPSDLLGMRTISFDHTDLASADEARGNIVAAMQRGLDGHVDSPISIAADLVALSRGGSLERQMAEVVWNLEELRGIVALQGAERMVLPTEPPTPVDPYVSWAHETLERSLGYVETQGFEAVEDDLYLVLMALEAHLDPKARAELRKSVKVARQLGSAQRLLTRLPDI